MDERIPFYLRHFKLEDNTENRLAAYNWGIGNVKRIGGVTEDNFAKIPSETQNYIRKYLKLTEK